MDPNEAIVMIRRLAASIAAPGMSPAPHAECVELAEAIQGLDTWLSSGGFLPAAWSDGTGRVSAQDPGAGVPDAMAQVVGEALLASTHATITSLETAVDFALDAGTDDAAYVLEPLRAGVARSRRRFERAAEGG